MRSEDVVVRRWWGRLEEVPVGAVNLRWRGRDVPIDVVVRVADGVITGYCQGILVSVRPASPYLEFRWLSPASRRRLG